LNNLQYLGIWFFPPTPIIEMPDEKYLSPNLSNNNGKQSSSVSPSTRIKCLAKNPSLV